MSSGAGGLPPTSPAGESQKYILVGEDSNDDFFVLKRAFAKAGLRHQLHQVSDGEKILAYLKGATPFTDRRRWPFPHLLILDIKMPLLSGFDVLAELRGGPHQQLPVVLVSGSILPGDREQAMKLGATDYFTKTDDFDQMISLARSVDGYLKDS